MAEVQTRDSVFLAGDIERVLGKSSGASTCERAKDLAGVVGRLTEAVTGPQSQLFEQVVGAELRLQPVVIRICSVGALAVDACTVAVDAAYVTGYV